VKRVYSLKSRESYKIIFFKGKRLRGKGNIIFVLKNSTGEKWNNKSAFSEIKIGIAVNKKLGKANKRNWIKRRIRAVCTELINQMNDGFSIIIKPGPEITAMSFGELRGELIMLFRNAGVLDGNT
jgi:ribonuclease P protein component